MKPRIPMNRRNEAPAMRRTFRTWALLILFTSVFAAAGAPVAHASAVCPGTDALEGTPAAHEAAACDTLRAEDSLKMALSRYDARDFDAARHYFETYIGLLPEKEQAVYRDVSTVATRKELKSYKDTPDSLKAEWVRNFWAAKATASGTEANEQLVEHYRRVAYARGHFSKGEFPWDDRGEVYVRLGAPNHIGRSGDIRIERNRDIQNARANFANRFYLGLAVVPGEPIFPVSSLARWEYWVYADIDGGAEFAFVNEYRNGRYTFAPLPEGLPLSLTLDLLNYQGNTVLERIAAR